MLANGLIIFTTILLWCTFGYLGGDDGFYSPFYLFFPIFWAGYIVYLRRLNAFRLALVGYGVFLLIWLADSLHFNWPTPRVEFAYLLFSAGMTQGLLVFFQLTSGKEKQVPRWASWAAFGFVFLITLLPIAFLVYFLNFDLNISRDVVFAILSTNTQESWEFVVAFLSPQSLTLALLVWVMFLWLLRTQDASRIHPVPVKFLGVQLVVTGVLFLTQFSYFELYRFPVSCVLEHRRELIAFRETQQRFQHQPNSIRAQKSETDELYVIVIGESLNKRHMGIYGYPRQTTPKFERYRKTGELLMFMEAFASHTYTYEVLPFSLSEADQRNGMNFFEAVSTISVLNQAGLETHWLTNQMLRGEYDNNVSVIAHQADQLLSFNHWIGKRVSTSRHDDVVLESFGQLLSEDEGTSRFLFIHLMGNHWIYSQRYPSTFAKYEEGETIPDNLGEASDHETRVRVNTYDNSVIFNDYVVGSLLDQLKEKGGVSAFLYFSDHGEDVVGGHSHHASHFTMEMVRIPMVMWLSDEYKERYPDKTERLEANGPLLFCTDSIHDTLLGIANVESDRYQPANDLSSDSYELDLSDAYTLHGTVRYDPLPGYDDSERKVLEGVGRPERIHGSVEILR